MPSTRFDHTVSRSLPMGVIKPIPVTATRRPLELTFTCLRIRTRRPTLHIHGVRKLGLELGHRVQTSGLDQLAEIQRQLQAKPAGGSVELAPSISRSLSRR